MILELFPSGPFATNAIFVACPQTKKAIFIDPAPGSASSLLDAATLHEAHVTAIYLTHSHWDHIADTAKLKNILHVPVYIHPLDKPNLIDPGSDGLPLFIPVPGVQPEFDLIEGEEHSVGQLKFRVIHTPGHTPGGVCFYFYEEGILISGDTLFKGSIGNLSFPTCNAEHMWQSLKKLETLPPETKVYPGHGSPTTIGKESWLPRARDIFG